MSELMTSFTAWLSPDVLGPIVLDWAGRIVAALLIFVIGRWLTGLLVGLFSQAISRANADVTLNRFLSSLVRMTLLAFVVLTSVSALGVPTTNFLAIIGAAGLAIGLALKDSLANFSSGVMLVFFRPFKVGDFVEVAGVSGVIESIGIFSTELKTGDNRVITVPNGLIYGTSIVNYSTEPTRRIDLTIGIGYDDDIQRAKALIQGVLNDEPRVLDEPAPTLLLMELADSTVNLAIRPWVKREDYWTTRSDLLERIKSVLESNGLSIPYPQRDVHLINQAAGNV